MHGVPAQLLQESKQGATPTPGPRPCPRPSPSPSPDPDSNPNQDCEECRNTARGIAIIFGIILGVLLVGYLLYLNRTRIRACLIVMSMLRRTITMARLKIVLSTFQVGTPHEPRPEPQAQS